MCKYVSWCIYIYTYMFKFIQIKTIHICNIIYIIMQPINHIITFKMLSKYTLCKDYETQHMNF